ncbi:helix-turn-helix domain-containing protein [Laribacter hongkongensis]|uniref:XRE family transcriptional regulator n=1 Tax=Laribacter hongkongensis TaxID=168471 RepID=UPI001EFD3651|nr:LexA family transcriptional regulator [Laribacter hongkongensis]MCG9054413.1 helix-turn-helix domain-containing protein [Laribacter hongkongensis]
MAIKDTLKALMEQRGITQNELGEKTKVPQPTIFRILSGESKDPRHSTVKPLADFFGVTVAQLRGDDPMEEDGHNKKLRPISVWDQETDLPNDEYVFLPSLSVKLSAGNGCVAWEVDEKGQRQAFTAKWARRMGVDPTCAATMVVDGDSMEPRLMDGDSVVIDYCKNDVIIDGRIYAIILNGELFIKRLFKEVGGGVKAVSDNPDKTRYPDRYVGPEHSDSLKIIGMAVAVSGGL